MATKVEVEVSLINKLTSGLNRAAGDFKRFELTAKNSIRSVSAGWGKLLSIQNVFYGVGTGALVKNIFDATMAYQGLQNSMEAAIGKYGDSNDELKKIHDESNRIGIDFEKVAGDYVKFSASATRAGISLQGTRDIFKDISETAVSLRLSPERTRLVFEALNQMASKNTVQMEELRGQLGDHIPAALVLAAKAVGMTSHEFIKAVKNGEILAYDFLPKFAKTVRDEMGGGFETASQQMQANLSRLKTAWFDFRIMVGEVATPEANQALVRLAQSLNSLSTDSEKVKRGFYGVVGSFSLLWNGAQMGVDAFTYLSEAVTTIVPSIGLRVYNGFKAITGIYADYKNVFKKFFTDAASGIDPKTGKTRRNEFEPALAKFTGGQAFEEFKTRLGLIKSETQTTADFLDGLLTKYNSKFEKNIEDSKQALKKLQYALSGADDFVGPPVPGKSGPYEKISPPDAAADEAAIKKKKDAWEKWLSDLERISEREGAIRRRWDVWIYNLEEKSNREGLENKKTELDQKILDLEKFLEANDYYQSAVINSMESGYDREIELSRLKYEQMQRDYAGHKSALMLIEDAFYVEQAAIEKHRIENQREATASWVKTVSDSLITIAGENKKFVGLYKAASIAQIVADTMTAAQAAYKSMVQSFGAYGIPAGVVAAGAVTAAGVARAATVAKQKFGLGTREYRAAGPQMIMVGDNPGGGREVVSVRPESSPNVNGPAGYGGGTTAIFNFYDHTGKISESTRREIRSGSADRMITDLLSRGRALGAVV